jgi:hypothetical protein
MYWDRLIDLAKRTGDRLIVHDPVNGNDMVILDIASYERLLVEGGKGVDWPPVVDFSEEEKDEKESPWQSTGDIIGERYGGEPKNGSVSFVEEMWAPMHDARAEREVATEQPVPQVASDEPVFYEEPLS